MARLLLIHLRFGRFVPTCANESSVLRGRLRWEVHASRAENSNLRISQLSETGDGRVLEDNTDVTTRALDAYDESVPEPIGTAASGGQGGDDGGGANGGSVGTQGGRGGVAGSGRGGTPNEPPQSGGRNGEAGELQTGAGTDARNPDGSTELAATGCVCSLELTRSRNGVAWLPFLLAGLVLVGRRRRGQRRGARGGGGVAVRPSSGHAWRG